MTKKNKISSMSAGSMVTLIALIAYVVIIIFLIVWAVVTSLKGRTDFTENPATLWPSPPMFKNYTKAFENFEVRYPTPEGTGTAGLWEMLLNTVLYMFGTTAAFIVVTFITAYLTARYDYYFSKIIVFCVIFAMSFTVVGGTPNTFKLLKSLGLFDSVLGPIIMNMGFASGTVFLFIHATARGIPRDLFDAARIDGASDMTMMLRIGLPMCSKILMTFFFLGLIARWNDYSTPMLFMPSSPTLAYGVFLYTGSHSSSISTIPERMVGAMFLLLPMLLIFVLFHKRLMGNATIGAIKG